MADKTAQELWLDYRFLTKEMAKFLIKKDMDLFYQLMNQRERLQMIIDQTADKNFANSPTGRNLLTEIKAENQIIIERLQTVFNNSKRQQQISDAYSGYNGESVNRNWNR